MPLTTHPVEPEAAQWRAAAFAELVADLQGRCALAGRRPVIAVDGRSASGKSTLATRLAAAIPGAEVVHTDDVAWWHDFFDWDDLLIANVLVPYSSGLAVDYRPPAWQQRGRDGSITVSAQCRTLIVEGVGTSRQSLGAHLSATVWVQSDVLLAEQRGIARDMITERRDPLAAKQFWDRWQEGERTFLADDRPWDRADVVACGTPLVVVGPHEVVLGTMAMGQADR